MCILVRCGASSTQWSRNHWSESPRLSKSKHLITVNCYNPNTYVWSPQMSIETWSFWQKTIIDLADVTFESSCPIAIDIQQLNSSGRAKKDLIWGRSHLEVCWKVAYNHESAVSVCFPHGIWVWAVCLHLNLSDVCLEPRQIMSDLS
jgi:hypothetical protein